MRKTSILTRLLTLLLALSLLAGVCAAAGPVRAAYSRVQIYVNGEMHNTVAYNIGGSNYFQLRQLAEAAMSSPSRFNVVWNEAARRVEVVTGQKYERPASGSGGVWTQYGAAAPSSAQLVVDGEVVAAAAYNIGGSNYYKLRDLAGPLGFDVDWRESDRSIHLCSHTESARYVAGSGGASTQPLRGERWGGLERSYLYEEDGALHTVDIVEGGVKAETLDPETYAVTASKTVPMELEQFGGFYAGERYNYIVFGQGNPDEDDSREVLRVVQYDKDFNRVAAAAVTDCYTVTPFEAGSLRMAEADGRLVVHTCRERYRTGDGLNHQSQLTVLVDTDTMEVRNDLGPFQPNHVSHSFNQFARMDGGDIVLLDHGDAYPRAIVMHRGSGGSYRAVELMDIPGPAGANCTGVSLGGFAATAEGYLAACSSIDHSRATGYDNYQIQGEDTGDRDAVLLFCDRRGGSVREIRLTDYAGRDLSASAPALVKLSEDRLAVLWVEYQNGAAAGVRCAAVDAAGRLQGEIQFLPGVSLPNPSAVCAVDGRVVWCCANTSGRLFCEIEV